MEPEAVNEYVYGSAQGGHGGAETLWIVGCGVYFSIYFSE